MSGTPRCPLKLLEPSGAGLAPLGILSNTKIAQGCQPGTRLILNHDTIPYLKMKRNIIHTLFWGTPPILGIWLPDYYLWFCLHFVGLDLVDGVLFLIRAWPNHCFFSPSPQYCRYWHILVSATHSYISLSNPLSDQEHVKYTVNLLNWIKEQLAQLLTLTPWQNSKGSCWRSWDDCLSFQA